MERGWLRSVPLRIDGPVDRAAAERHVGEALPELGGDARRALALVEIAGRERADVAAEMGIAREALADLLYRARKVLRRSMFPLSASGWCERAERMLSDRLDGVLEPPATARLDVHLRHCDRCVEHERRLAQARERLVRGFLEAQRPAPAPEPERAPPAPAAELRVVEPDEAPKPEEAPEPDEAPAERPSEAEPPAEREAPPEPPADRAEPPAIEPPAPAPPPRRSLVPASFAHGSVIWASLHVLALVLAIASLVITVLAAAGAIDRVF